MGALGVEPEWKQKNEISLPPQHAPTPEESLTSHGHNFAASQDSDFTISGCLATAQASLKQNMTIALDDVVGDVNYIMEDIYKRLESKDDALTATVREFCKQYKKISGIGAWKHVSYCKPSLISAFHNFGKGHGQKIKWTKRTIRVQTTAVSRRITKRCGGKKLKAGRATIF